MSDIAIKVENLSKQYRLGEVGTGTISHDLNRWWAKMRGKEDPFLKIGETNDRSKKGDSDYVWALKDINFEVKKGEVLGIIGKNGAGKSTLLKILSKVTGPTIGEIKGFGRIASLLEVGTGFHPELTGRENIYLNGTILGMTKAEVSKKLDEIVDFAGVERYLDTPVKRYSSGMMVRLGFAVAAHLEPEILIVDEVLAVGDAEFQKKAIGKMQEVSSGQGRTVLFVSHNMGSVRNLCSKLVLLEQGEIKFIGSSKDGIKQYLMPPSKETNFIIPLHNIKNRSGNGQIVLTDIKLYDCEERKIIKILSGDLLKLQLSYAAKNIIHGVAFRIIFYDTNGDSLFICNNHHSWKLINISKESGTVMCLIPRFPLTEGSYRMNLSVMTMGEILDSVDIPYNLEVEKGDFFGTGFLPKINNTVLVNHCWKVID